MISSIHKVCEFEMHYLRVGGHTHPELKKEGCSDCLNQLDINYKFWSMTVIISAKIKHKNFVYSSGEGVTESSAMYEVLINHRLMNYSVLLILFNFFSHFKETVYVLD